MGKFGGDEEEVVYGIYDIRAWWRESIHPGSILAWMDCDWSRDLGCLESLCLKNYPKTKLNC